MNFITSIILIINTIIKQKKGEFIMEKKFLTQMTAKELNKVGIVNDKIIPYDMQDTMETEVLNILGADGMQLRNVKNPTKQMIEIALTDEPAVIQFLENPTLEQCTIAFRKSHGNAIKYVKNQTEEICTLALSWAIDYTFLHKMVKRNTPTEKLAKYKKLMKTQKNESPIMYIDKPTELMSLMAVQKGHSLKFITNQSASICSLAIMNDPNELKFVHEQTDAVIQTALAYVKQRGWSSNDIVKYIR